MAADEDMQNSYHDLNTFIDHTALKAHTTRREIEELCRETQMYNFASVCVNSSWVPLCAKLMQDSKIPVCTVVGFPLGSALSKAKAEEARLAHELGAQEIDMVLNVGRLRSGEFDAVREDIAAVVQASGSSHVKVILETCWLNDEEKAQACQLAMEAGAHYVKTSTGFGAGGATVQDVALMRRVVGSKLGVKASGGIRCREDAIKMIEAGASRLGTSAGIAIVAATETGNAA